MSHPIPAHALAHHIAILGKTGSGKSNAAKTVVEGAMDAGERVCVIDPTGAWYGLRLDPDGSPSKYPVAIFGGLHADMPISRAHGAAIGEVIASASTPAVIDTRLMTVGERTEFFTAFAQTLLRKNQGPLRLVIDEAHVFAPQGRVADPRSGEMLHAANNLVSLGRSIGLRIIMLSQRPAKLHKDSLTQVETLVAMRVIAPHDVAAVQDWIGEWAGKEQGREIIASLPSLPTGDAWIWSPEIGFLERRHFPLAKTYDSGRPLGADGKQPNLQAIDLSALKDRLASVEAEAKANDPRVLKAEIARLKGELAKQPLPAPTDGQLEGARQGGYHAGWLAGIEEGERRGQASGQAVMLARVQSAIGDLRIDSVAKAPEKPQEAPRPRPATMTPPKPAPAIAPQPVRAERAPNAKGALGLVEAAARVHPVRLTWGQVAVLAGRKPSGGHFNSSRKTALDNGWMEESGGLVTATPTGMAEAGVEPRGGDPVQIFAEALPQPAAKMFAVIREQPGITIFGLADVLQMQPRGGHWNTGMSTLRRNGLIEENGAALRVAEIA